MVGKSWEVTPLTIRGCSHPDAAPAAAAAFAQLAPGEHLVLRYAVHAAGRTYGLEEAAAVLKQADENGLVHLSLYRPNHSLYALCSCCPCCCHDLQLLLRYRQSRLVARADYTAATDIARCTNCGECVDCCPFGAREIVEGALHYQPERCYGCGLCVSACPTEAIELKLR